MKPGKISAVPGWIAILCLLLCGSCGRTVSLDSLILDMTSRENLTYFPEPLFKHRQFSSHNPLSVSTGEKGWFANEDMSHFIRVEQNDGRREFVMFDADGPGAIVRWWMTFYIAGDGIIRVYLDNDTDPVLSGKPYELLSGNMLAGPPLAISVHKGVIIKEKGRDLDHNLYLPIPFARHCKITYECDTLNLNEEGNYFPDVFYNIGYREYEGEPGLRSFSLPALQRSKSRIEEANRILCADPEEPEEPKSFSDVILPGDSVSVRFDTSGRAVSYLSLSISAFDSCQALRSTVLSATFDGVETIRIPAGDFFGTGYMMHPHKTRMNQTHADGLMESEWLMPFREKCRLTFINFGTEPVTVTGRAGLTSYNWKSNSMYFGAAWHPYFHVNTRRDGEPYLNMNFIDIEGKGVYVGDQVCLFNTSYQWWGEGDEKITVDGESFPSSFGTGSEDYYGYAFGRPEPFSHPFISQPVGDGNEGNTNDGGLTVDMRHRSLDAIPFTRSISANIELWHWADTRIDISLTSYFYVQLPYKMNIRWDAEEVRRPVARSSRDFEK